MTGDARNPEGDAPMDVPLEVVRARAADIGLEADYARTMLEDLKGIHDGIGDVADLLASASVALLTIVTTPPERRGEFALDAMTHTRDAMANLLTMQRKANGILELMKGRAKVLAAEVSELDNFSRKVDS